MPASLLPVLRWGAQALSIALILGFGLLAITVGVPTAPEDAGLSSAVTGPITLGVLVFLALSWLVSWRWHAVGAASLAVGGLLLGVLASMAYHPIVTLAVGVLFALPAFLLWLAWQQEQRFTIVVAVAIATAVSLGGAYTAAWTVHDHFYGPQHPVSATVALPVDRVDWVWSGGVVTDGASVTARLAEDADRVRVVAVPGAGGEDLRTDAPGAVVAEATISPTRVARAQLTGLAPDTRYAYAIEVDGEIDATRGRGHLRTMPAGAASFEVTVGSCAATGSSGAVFDTIREIDPLLHVIAGDLHYDDIAADDPARFHDLYDRVLTAPPQAALYREVPIAYLWDDHDYGANDATSTSPSRPAARATYREVVPHYPLASDGAIPQAFTVGRVRFVMTDTRSERTPDSMLGDEQLAWLKDELVAASRTHALVVWVNPDPWIADPDPTADDWGAYPGERDEILAHLEANDVDDLVMLSGDAHMVAIDDGTNSGGFPILHAGALDRPGSVKGGPYSEGAFPGAGQFGRLQVTDTGGDQVTVRLVGETWDGTVLVSHTFEVAVADGE